MLWTILLWLRSLIQQDSKSNHKSTEKCTNYKWRTQNSWISNLYDHNTICNVNGRFQQIINTTNTKPLHSKMEKEMNVINRSKLGWKKFLLLTTKLSRKQKTSCEKKLNLCASVNEFCLSTMPDIPRICDVSWASRFHFEPWYIYFW